MPKSIPTLGSANWGQPLNDHLSQLNDPINGGINSVATTFQRPSTLTTNDKGFTAINKATGNLHQWSGSAWEVLNQSVINVKDFGAVGDNIADDGPAIQAAIDFCIANEHSGLFIPDGNYKYTVSPTIPTDKYLSIRGNSRKAILRPNGCHGLIINNNNTEAPHSIITHLTINGSGCGNFAGIHIAGTQQSIGDATTGGGLARVFGYTFEYIEIYSFGIGIHVGYGNIIRIFNNNILQCYHGVVLRGQVIYTQIRGNYIAGPSTNPTTQFTDLQPTGMRIGIFIGSRTYNAGILRCESVHISDNLVYGYDTAISNYDCLYCDIKGNDCDNSLKLGIWFNQDDGGLRIENNWIGMNSSAGATIAGINNSSTSNSGNLAKVSIKGNQIISYGSASAVRGGKGIWLVPTYAKYTDVVGNAVDCQYFEYGIFADGVEGTNIVNNSVYATLAAGGEYIYLKDCSNPKVIDNNTNNNGYKLPKITGCYSTIGRHFITGIGNVEQFGDRFSFFDGSYTREWKGANNGDFQTNPSLYSIQSGPNGLPTSPIGLASGSKWVDTANGNVIKQV
jgi:hypothetical protein